MIKGKKIAAGLLTFVMALTVYVGLPGESFAGICDTQLSLENVTVSSDEPYDGAFTYNGKYQGFRSLKALYRGAGMSEPEDITDKVTIVGTKQKDCGTWFVTVRADPGSGYTGEVRKYLLDICPGSVTDLKATYSRKTKCVELAWKMPALKDGQYEYLIYTGSRCSDPFRDLVYTEDKTARDRVVKYGASSWKDYEGGKMIRKSLREDLEKGVYQLAVRTNAISRTNKSGQTRENGMHASSAPEETFFAVK